MKLSVWKLFFTLLPPCYHVRIHYSVTCHSAEGNETNKPAVELPTRCTQNYTARLILCASAWVPTASWFECAVTICMRSQTGKGMKHRKSNTKHPVGEVQTNPYQPLIWGSSGQIRRSSSKPCMISPQWCKVGLFCRVDPPCIAAGNTRHVAISQRGLPPPASWLFTICIRIYGFICASTQFLIPFSELTFRFIVFQRVFNRAYGVASPAGTLNGWSRPTTSKQNRYPTTSWWSRTEACRLLTANFSIWARGVVITCCSFAEYCAGQMGSHNCTFCFVWSHADAYMQREGKVPNDHQSDYPKATHIANHYGSHEYRSRAGWIWWNDDTKYCTLAHLTSGLDWRDEEFIR